MPRRLTLRAPVRIGAGDTGLGQDFPGQLAEAAAHAVADDGVADLPGDGEAEPHDGIAVAALADQQHEAGRRRALAAVRGQEVRAAAELGDGRRGG